MNDKRIEAAERMADALEDILYTEYTAEDLREANDAWQAYVEVAAQCEEEAD